jgi:hypothetical protein
MNRVLVVESGSKTKTIRSFLGGEYDIVASGGHIVDLPDYALGIDIDDFSYTLEPIQRRDVDAVAAIRSKLEDGDEHTPGESAYRGSSRYRPLPIDTSVLRAASPVGTRHHSHRKSSTAPSL